MKPLRNLGVVTVALVVILAIAREILTLTWTLPPVSIQTSTALIAPERDSTLVLPVRFDLSELSQFANSTFPKHMEGTEFSSATHPVIHGHGLLKRPTVTREPDAHVDWNFNRGPIQISGGNDHIQIFTTLSGGGRLVPPDLKPQFRGSVSADTTLAIKDDYTFFPKLKLDAHLDQVKLGFLNLTGLVRGVAQKAVASSGPSLSQKISQVVDLRRKAETVWSILPRVVQIPGTKDVWITLSPEAVLFDGPHVDANAIRAFLGIRLSTQCFLQSSAPPNPKPTPLPSRISPISDDHFRIVLPIEMQLDELNKLITKSLVPYSDVALPKGGTVHISDVSLAVQNGGLVVQASIEGRNGFWARKIKGIIRCQGIPQLQSSPPTLSFSQLSFSTETQSALLRTAAWLLNPVILKVLQDHAVIDLSKQFDVARLRANTLAEQITLPAPLQLGVTIENLAPVDIRFSNSSIFTCIEASGKATLSLHE